MMVFLILNRYLNLDRNPIIFPFHHHTVNYQFSISYWKYNNLISKSNQIRKAILETPQSIQKIDP